MLLETSKHHCSSQLWSQQSSPIAGGAEGKREAAAVGGQGTVWPARHTARRLMAKGLSRPLLPAATHQGQERPPAPGAFPQGCDSNDPRDSRLPQPVLVWKGFVAFLFV